MIAVVASDRTRGDLACVPSIELNRRSFCGRCVSGTELPDGLIYIQPAAAAL
jgi:hypothetical protein